MLIQVKLVCNNLILLFQVNIEKAYAFAEFITPEDATTALGFDGVTLHGTILKIRRPKDFIAPEVRNFLILQ